ncbi:MAG: AAA family ATPase [Candidatus Woesebacteria bacterium]|jgi:DNA replication and repair protein RecF
MILQSIALQNFRNHKTAVFKFSKKTTLILGPNGSGKTSVIEAIDLLSAGISFRAQKVEEMIRFEQELARVKGKVMVEQEGKDRGESVKRGVASSSADSETKFHDLEEIDLELVLTRGIVQGKRTLRTLYSVNGVRRQKKKFLGNFYSVVFRPEDLRLIEGSPGRRRSYLDHQLSILDPQYAASLKTYENALRKRNKLLLGIREGEFNRSILKYWDLTILKHGQILQEKRQGLIDFIQTVDFPLAFSIKYLPSLISEERLKQYAYKEVMAGHTLIGPHKDDFEIGYKKVDHRSIASFGSRGQQRMAVLWLKLAELLFIRNKARQEPVLLLDDILSELDEESREMTLGLLGRRQAVVSTTDPSLTGRIEKVVGDLGKIELENKSK